jgi:DNA-binding response OmpR family regulator
MWLGRGAAPKGVEREIEPILVVDDDEDIRAFLREALLEWGYRVVCADDGDDAMAIARQVVPAAIILDLWLPRVSGFTFRAWQLEQPQLVDVPVIVLTAAGPAAIDRLADVAALHKPVDLDLLRVLLDALQVRPPKAAERERMTRSGIRTR